MLDDSRQGEATLVAGPGAGGRKLYLESYGCQMNFSDSEIVASILADAGFQTTREADDADLVLLNTCAIRDNAEQRVRNRLVHFKKHKAVNPKLVVGVPRCPHTQSQSCWLLHSCRGSNFNFGKRAGTHFIAFFSKSANQCFTTPIGFELQIGKVI